MRKAKKSSCPNTIYDTCHCKFHLKTQLTGKVLYTMLQKTRAFVV